MQASNTAGGQAREGERSSDRRRMARGLLSRTTLQRYFSLLFLLLTVLFFWVQTTSFLTVRNMSNVVEQCAVLVVVAMGGTFVIMAGSIDLSVGSVMGLSAVVTAGLLKHIGLWAIFVGVSVGVLCGLVNGFTFAKLKIPSFIATLGMMIIARGLNLIYTNGAPITIFVDAFLFVGQGRIGKVPNIFVIALVVFVISFVVSKYTVFGRNIRAMGGEERVSRLSGIRIDRTKLLLYAFAGFYSGLGGVIMASRLGAGTPLLGSGLELDVIAAVVLGGTPLTGGVGGVLGTIIGSLVMITLGNGLNIMGVSPYAQMIVKGIFLIIAVWISFDREKIGVIK